MLRIRAALRANPERASRAIPCYVAELYDASPRGDLLDWRCPHDHDNRFAALTCGHAELARRQYAQPSRRRDREAVAAAAD